MNIDTFTKLTKFISTKNKKYSIDNPNLLNTIMSVKLKDYGYNRQNTIDLYNYLMESGFAINSESLGHYLDLYEYVSERFREFEKLKEMGKIDFKIDGNIIKKLTSTNFNNVNILINKYGEEVDSRFFRPFLNLDYGNRIKLLNILRTENPSFLSELKTNEDFENLFVGGVSKYYERRDESINDFVLELINDDFFVKQINQKEDGNFDPYNIISILVSNSDKIELTLSKLGDVGKKFYNDMKMGDMFLYMGYYKNMFWNRKNFINVSNFFGEEITTDFIIEYIKSTGQFFIFNMLSSVSPSNREFLGSMDLLWEKIKKEFPKNYESLWKYVNGK